MTFLVISSLILVAIMLINYLQTKHNDFLPSYLKSWDFLPLYLRSLQPYDDLITNYLCFSKFFIKITNKNNQNNHAAITYNDDNKNANEPKVVFVNDAYQF